jgi:hypothetical protein
VAQPRTVDGEVVSEQGDGKSLKQQAEYRRADADGVASELSSEASNEAVGAGQLGRHVLGRQMCVEPLVEQVGGVAGVLRQPVDQGGHLPDDELPHDPDEGGDDR